MGSLLTNASAQTALRQLRSVSAEGDNVRDVISTGLKVRTAEDNPAFFVVSNKTRGDTAILRGIRDNLTLTRGAIDAAQAGVDALDRLVLQLADIVPAAQNGIAIAELTATYDEIIDQARQVIDSAGFQGTNLLEQSDTASTIIGLDRQGDSFGLQTLAVSGGDFLRKEFNNAIVEAGSEFVIQANNFSGRQDVGGNSWQDSPTEPGYLQWGLASDPNQIYTTPAQVTANAPRLDYRVQITNPGRYYVNVRGRGFSGTSDSVHVGVDGNVLTGTGGVRIPTGAGGRWGTRDTLSNQRVFIDIAAPGLYTINIWGRENGTAIEGVQFTDDPSEPAGATPLPPATAIGNSDLAFFSDPVDGAARRESAGFIELLNALTPEAMRLAPESAMEVLDAARVKLNRYGAEIGAYERVIERQQTYLDGLTAGLDGAVAALVEADLQEQAGRLAAIEVQEQLAVQALSITNSRTSLVLSLFQ